MGQQGKRSVTRESPARWVLLIHQIPPKPAYLRVKVSRQLRKIGAVAVKNSVYVAPASPEFRAALTEVIREIHGQGGGGAICEARFVEGLSDDAIGDLFREAREVEYAAIAEEARNLAAGLPRRITSNGARRRSAVSRLERLKRRFKEILAKDPFAARGREMAAGLLSLVEDRLQGVETPAAGSADLPCSPRGARWVTRRGVMVDRIASAWLIRRFIDTDARFKFVAGRGYRPARGELRFDMAGAEFTHEGDRCTFEVLVERFRVRDSALRPIAEIVHELDLKDEQYERPESTGLDRMIVGIALANPGDDARLAQGGPVFDNLYEYFRKHGSRPSGTKPAGAETDRDPRTGRRPPIQGRER